MVIKKNGDREEYDRKKIEQSFRIACNKRPIAEVIIQESITIIEDTVLDSNKMEIGAFLPSAEKPSLATALNEAFARLHYASTIIKT